MRKARIVIATPSLIDQSRLQKAIEQASGMQIVAQTTDLSATYSRVEELIPDIVIVAEGFTLQDEYQCMVSLFRAVEASVILLGSGLGGDAPSGTARSNLTVINSRMEPSDLLSAITAVALGAPGSGAKKVLRGPPKVLRTGGFQEDKVILLGASTGGIDALTNILQHFPIDCPPTAIVQHTGQNFSETLARLLDRRCAAEVVVAETGLEMKPGRVCLAGGIDGHLRLERRGILRCEVRRGAATSGHIPSIDELFNSALPLGDTIVAALLTGMGRDGASGLLQLRRAGATTFGQDEASSVVYGMPRVANEIGAVQRQLALDDIGPALLQACMQSRTLIGRVGT